MANMRRYIAFLILSAGLLVALATGKPAAADSGEFSIQVSPSPLVATVKPGQATTLELNVHNGSTATENLKIVPRAFSIDKQTDQLQLEDTQLPDVASWITFSASSFSLLPGQTTTQKITLSVPKEAGFSYAFALVISRANADQQTVGRNIKASVAVFTLLNVDRPGAVRSLEVTSFKATKGLYEYLPAEFLVEFKNTGNTIVQPSGSVFIQRGSNDPIPIDVLPINKGGGYILPGTTRTIHVNWSYGFQVANLKTLADGTTKEELTWNWNQLSAIRFGQYTAKLVAIYDDGKRDIPLQSELTFWVLPWKMLLVILVIVALIVAGAWTLIRKTWQLPKKFNRKKMRF